MPKLLIVLLLLVFVAGFFLFKDKMVNPANGLNIQVITVKEETKLYKITAEYPQFAQAPSEFNDRIQKLITSQIADYKKTSLENWQQRQQNDPTTGDFPDNPWSFNSTWTAVRLNNQDISFVIRINSFTGGANENQNIYSFNYDLKNKKDLSLSALFGSDYLKVVSSYCADNLTARFTNIFKEGVAPKEENYSRFTFTDDFVTFYFPKAQVVPAVFGEQQVNMPRNLSQ